MQFENRLNENEEPLFTHSLLLKFKSFLKLSFYLLKRNPLSLVGGIFMLLIILMALLGPFFTVYDPIKTMITFRVLGPRTAAIAIAKIMVGNAWMLSKNRMISSSTHRP